MYFFKGNDEPCTDHHFVIESAVIVPALRSYVEHFHAIECSQKDGDSVNLNNNTICRLLKSDDVAKFWQSFINLIPLHRERMWSALENGLSRYLHVSLIVGLKFRRRL